MRNKTKAEVNLEKRLNEAQHAKECYRSKANRRLKSEFDVSVQHSESRFSMLEENYQQKFDYLEKEIAHLHSSIKVLPPSFPVASSLADNCESLIGKQIFQKWKDAGGKETWYRGHVLGLVPGWYSVQYNGEDDTLSLNLLEDIGRGDLEIMS